MGVSGFPIKAIASGLFDQDESWFNTAEASFTAVFQSGSRATFPVSNLFGFKVGQTVEIAGGSYNAETGTITSIEDDKAGHNIFTNIAFTGSDSGIIFVDGSIEWDVKTPEDFLREIHVQFDIGGSVAFEVEVTTNGEIDWMLINNGDPIVGLQTFTMFVTKDTLLNFRIHASESAPDDVPVTCIVTAA